MSPNFEIGSIVWVRLGQKWWPGRVSSLDECPVQYISNLKKEPLAVVRFFNESEFHDVSKQEHIFSYSCSRKNDFIRKGLNSVKYDPALAEKFEADVTMAEKLTGGNMDIVKELKETTRAKIDYSDLGFGTPKPKKQSKDQCMQRRGFSDIGEAIQYKRGSSPLSVTVIEHKVKIMEQPKQKVEEMKASTTWFKCYICGFTCERLNVIIWHNKMHLKKVEDYDSGIHLPGRRKRRRKTQRNKMRKILKSEAVDHSQTNGHVSPKRDPSREASQLLLDWEDDDDQEDNEEETKVDNSVDEETAAVNGVDVEENGGNTSDEFDNDSEDDDYDNEYPTHKGQRQPMPKQVDINSAFDALLAESSPLHRNNQSTSYVANDSDSECSDWEKYYAKESEEEEDKDEEEEEDNESMGEENQQNGHYHSQKQNQEHSSKRPKRTPSSDSSNGITLNADKHSQSNAASSKSESKKSSSSTDYVKKSKVKTKSRSRSPQPRKSSKSQSSKEVAAAASPASPGPSISKSSSPLPERTREEQSEEHSTHSSSSSTSSGPAYMLVAVDAHGNNVPMPVLSEGGNHLVAVEASMEDGTTRTLYIDPAHLGPNVDLNNLMLHIDNSGQETVIIPTSTSDGEIISSTLVEQPQDSNVNAEEEERREDGKDDRALRERKVENKCETIKTPDEGLVEIIEEEKVEDIKEGEEEPILQKSEDEIILKGSNVDCKELPTEGKDEFVLEEGNVEEDDELPTEGKNEFVLEEDEDHLPTGGKDEFVLKEGNIKVKGLPVEQKDEPVQESYKVENLSNEESDELVHQEGNEGNIEPVNNSSVEIVNPEENLIEDLSVKSKSVVIKESESEDSKEYKIEDPLRKCTEVISQETDENQGLL